MEWLDWKLTSVFWGDSCASLVPAWVFDGCVWSWSKSNYWNASSAVLCTKVSTSEPRRFTAIYAFTLSHLQIYIFTPSHLQIYIFTPSHLQIYIFTLSHLQIYIFTPSHLLIYIFTPSHLLIYIFTPSHLQIYIFTPSHLQIYIFTPSHLLIYFPAPSHLQIFSLSISSFLSLALLSIFPSKRDSSKNWGKITILLTPPQPFRTKWMLNIKTEVKLRF